MSPQALVETAPRSVDSAGSPGGLGPRPMLAATASALMLWSAFPPADLWGMAWVALFPLFLLIPSRRSRASIYLGAWAGGLVFWLLSIQWVRLTDSDAWLAWVVMATALSFWWPGFLALARLAVLRLRLPIMFAAPVLWVALEFVRAHILTGFPWYYLAHSQHAVLPLIQIADLSGALGLSFLIALINAWLVDLRTLPIIRATPRGPRLERPQVVRLAILALLILGTLGYGTLRIASARFVEGPRLALLQSNLEQRRKMAADPDKLLSYYRDLVDQARRATEAPDLIVWPETSFPYPYVIRDPKLDTAGFERVARRFDPRHGGDYWKDWETYSANLLHQWTDAIKTPMLVGSLTYDFEPEGVSKFNSALLFQPGVSTIQRYAKIHLVPFGEYVPLIKTFPWLTVLTPYRGTQVPSLTFGRGPSWFALGPYRLATAICFEDSVPQAVRRFFVDARKGRQPDLLINLSNDGWFQASSELDVHLAVSVFRAVENRVPLARAVNTGLSALIDGNGKVLDVLPKLETRVLCRTVPLDGRVSLYSAWGDWLGQSCLALSIVVIPAALVRRRLEPRLT